MLETNRLRMRTEKYKNRMLVTFKAPSQSRNSRKYQKQQKNNNFPNNDPNFEKVNQMGYHKCGPYLHYKRYRSLELR